MKFKKKVYYVKARLNLGWNFRSELLIQPSNLRLTLFDSTRMQITCVNKRKLEIFLWFFDMNFRLDQSCLGKTKDFSAISKEKSIVTQWRQQTSKKKIYFGKEFRFSGGRFDGTSQFWRAHRHHNANYYQEQDSYEVTM